MYFLLDNYSFNELKDFLNNTQMNLRDADQIS